MNSVTFWKQRIAIYVGLVLLSVVQVTTRFDATSTFSCTKTWLFYVNVKQGYFHEKNKVFSCQTSG